MTSAARFFKVLADEARLKIVWLLFHHDELCVCDIMAALGINAVAGVENLIDREGKRYLQRGLKYAAPTGPRIEQALLDDPLLLRTPIVRAGDRATVGFAPEVWATWLSSS
ncbi:MAG: ArsC/Spx/MgsR family protein [Polyangia bacterium]